MGKNIHQQHELLCFQMCTFGDGGYYYHDNADRAVCACGWISAPIQNDKSALILLWKAHAEMATNSEPGDTRTYDE